MATQTLGLVGTLSSTGTISGRLSNATLRGERIELRVNENNYLQYRYEGQSDSQWQDLIELNNLNYEELINKPTINNVTLIGDLTPADLGLSSDGEGVASIVRNGLVYTVTRPDGTTFTFSQLDQENVIESVSVNGTQLPINNKNVNVAVPTAVSELTNDANYATQSYVDSGIDSIAAAIPTKVSDLTNDASYTTQTYVDTELAKKQDTLPMGEVTSADIGKALMPKTVENGEVTEWEFGEAGKVDDVQINGTSILSNKVANIPVASNNNLGAVKIYSAYGVAINNNNQLAIQPAENGDIKTGTNVWKPIIPYHQHRSTFYGLAKAAGDSTQSASSNAVGTYTASAKSAIQSMLGIDTAIANAVGQITGFDFSVVQELPASGVKGVIYLVAHSHGDNDGYDEYIWINNGFEKLGHCDIDLTDYATIDYVDNELENKVDDVQIDGTSIVSDGVANVPIGTDSSYGLVKGWNRGIQLIAGQLMISTSNDATYKSGTSIYAASTIANQHKSAFYGLAKAAGDSTQSASANAVGTYTDDAKSAIQTMLGVPADDEVVKDVQINGTSIVNNGNANIPIASSANAGVLKINGLGLNMLSDNRLCVVKATDAEVKAGSNNYDAVVPSQQHKAVFYGLAKLAGADMASSSNAVGTYTTEAKTAIKSMLGVNDGIEVVRLV